jgi:hypothetical protein
MLLIGSRIQLTPGLANIRPHYCIQMEIRRLLVHTSHDIHIRSQSSTEACSILQGFCFRLGNEVVDIPTPELNSPLPVYTHPPHLGH